MFLGHNDHRTETFADHVDYAVQLIGEDHVGIALDYVFDHSELEDYVQSAPDLFPTDFGEARMNLIEPGTLPAIAELLARRGYGEIGRATGRESVCQDG